MKKILISGGSGLIGQSMSDYLDQNAFKVNWLSRSNKQGLFTSYLWNPEKHELDIKAFHSTDVLIQLAGCSIADKLWTPKRKKEIINSRIQAIQTLCAHLKKENIRIPQIIQVSAIGIYGDRNTEILDENAEFGEHQFLPEVCKIWEAEAYKLQEFTDHFCIIRIGLYLNQKGGIWTKMIQSISFRFLNFFGSGQQIYSWIHYLDFNRAISFLIDKKLSGVFNFTAPNPVSNKVFMKQICAQLSGVTLLFSIPKFILKLILGERKELVLSSTYVIPKALLNHGFKFMFEKSNAAIQDLLH